MVTCVHVAGPDLLQILTHIRVVLGIAAATINVSNSMMSNRVAKICSSQYLVTCKRSFNNCSLEDGTRRKAAVRIFTSIKRTLYEKQTKSFGFLLRNQ